MRVAGGNRSVAILEESSNPYRIVVSLAIPAILEQLSRIAAQYVDAAMVGSLGAYATAAVGINASTMVLLGGLQQAIGIGFCVQAAMVIGAGKSASEVTRQAILISLLIGLAMSLGMQVVGKFSPLWLGTEPDVAPFATAYIKIVAGASLFQALSVTASALLRGAGDTRTPFYVNLLANLLNVAGNFLLIPTNRVLNFGGFSFSVWGAGLGVEGAAIATAASMAFSGFFLFCCLCRTKTSVRFRPGGRKTWRANREIILPMLHISIPIALERFVLALGHILLTAMVANLGTVAIASHYIVNTVATISYETAMGFSYAGTTLVAQCFGAGKPSLAHRYTLLCLQIGVCVSLVFSGIVFTASPAIIRIFTANAVIIALSTFIVRMDAVSEPLFSVSTVLCGVFRGYGDAKYTFWVSFLGILVTRLTLGYLLGYSLGWGLIGIWVGIFIDIVLRGIMCLVHLRKYRAQGV